MHTIPFFGLSQHARYPSLAHRGIRLRDRRCLPGRGPRRRWDARWALHFPPMHFYCPLSFPIAPPRKPCLRHPNRVKKGDGPESRSNFPDPHDSYDYIALSPSYRRLSELGRGAITMAEVTRLLRIVDSLLADSMKKLTVRNRWANRRKPNAFHWLDENWSLVSPIFGSAVRQLFSPPAVPRVVACYVGCRAADRPLLVLPGFMLQASAPGLDA